METAPLPPMSLFLSCKRIFCATLDTSASPHLVRLICFSIVIASTRWQQRGKRAFQQGDFDMEEFMSKDPVTMHISLLPVLHVLGVVVVDTRIHRVSIQGTFCRRALSFSFIFAFHDEQNRVLPLFLTRFVIPPTLFPFFCPSLPLHSSPFPFPHAAARGNDARLHATVADV